MSKLIRKKRGASGAWRVHDDDVRTAVQLFACGLVRRRALASAESAERFVQLGFAVAHVGVFALTGRGKLATILSLAVWAEWARKRRLARRSAPTVWRRLPPLYPAVAPQAWLDDAMGRAASMPIPLEVAMDGVPDAVASAFLPGSAWQGTDTDPGDFVGHADVGRRQPADRLWGGVLNRDEAEAERYASDDELAAAIDDALDASERGDDRPPSRRRAA